MGWETKSENALSRKPSIGSRGYWVFHRSTLTAESVFTAWGILRLELSWQSDDLDPATAQRHRDRQGCLLNAAVPLVDQLEYDAGLLITGLGRHVDAHAFVVR